MKRLGCLAIVAVVVIGLILVVTHGSSSSTSAAQATPATLGKVGDTLTHGDWAVTLNSMKTADTLGDTGFQKKAQGTYVVLTVTLKNVSKETTIINGSDFTLTTKDGTKYKTSSDGSLALSSATPAPLIALEQIQPQLSKQYQVVFDVPNTTTTYTLSAAGNLFQITAP